MLAAVGLVPESQQFLEQKPFQLTQDLLIAVLGSSTLQPFLVQVDWTQQDFPKL